MQETKEKTFVCPECGSEKFASLFDISMAVKVVEFERDGWKFTDFEFLEKPEIDDLEPCSDYFHCTECDTEFWTKDREKARW